MRVQARIFGASYKPKLEEDEVVPGGWFDSSELTGKTTDNKGYCFANPIFFDSCVNSAPMTQIVLFASEGGILIARAAFPELGVSLTPRSVRILFSGTGWLFRV